MALGSVEQVFEDVGDAVDIAGAVVSGNPEAAAPAAQNIYGQFSAGGSVNAQRAARAQWFLNNAVAGNVAAAQCLLGGLHTVASNELPMYQAAVSALQSTAAGQEIWAAAVSAGPLWSLSDSAASYPQMQGWVTAWAADHAPAVSRPTNPLALSPLFWVGAAVVVGGGAFLLSRKRGGS